MIDKALRDKEVEIADTKPSVAEGPKAKPYLWALRLLVSAEDEVSSGFDAAFEEVALHYGALTASTLRRLHRAASKVSPRPSLLATAEANCGYPAFGSTAAHSSKGNLGTFLEKLKGLKRMLPYGPREMLMQIAGPGGLAPDAKMSFLDQLIAEMRCGSGPGWVDRCREYFKRLDVTECAADGGSGGDDRKDEGVRLSTIHSAKGLEFKAVFIVGLNTRHWRRPDRICPSGPGLPRRGP